jgi:hypothetical protein
MGAASCARAGKPIKKEAGETGLRWPAPRDGTMEKLMTIEIVVRVAAAVLFVVVLGALSYRHKRVAKDSSE